MLRFKPWRRILAERDLSAQRRWMQDVADNAHRSFRAGSEASHGGRVYRLKGGALHRASYPGAWPAKRTGKLLGSIRKRVTTSTVEIGTTAKYGIFLRMGTSKMKRRKMSDNALKEGIRLAKTRRGAFARFRAV